MNNPVYIGKYGVMQTLIKDISHGVIDYPDCRNGMKEMDHSALLVGYGTMKDTKQDYWIIKNSWGKGTGYMGTGYFLLARNKGNQCGITNHAFIPVA